METLTAFVSDDQLYSTRFKREVNMDRGFILHVKEQPDVTGGMWLGMVLDGTSDTDGERAACLALRAAYAHAARLVALLPQQEELADRGETCHVINGIFRDMFEAAHRELISRATLDLREYATTVSAALIWGDTVYTANLGDSPIWLFRRREDGSWLPPDRLYTCHNGAGERLEAGELSENPREACRLKSYIGSDFAFDERKIAFCQMLLEMENILLLGSDGALDLVFPEDAAATVTSSMNMEELRENLKQRKEAEGSTDNLTLIAARVFLQ